MAVDLSKLVDLERLKEEQDIEHGMIAQVESTSTASKAYEIGDRFYFKGKLCICTAPIASGGTITLNTNCKLDVLGDDVSELKTAIFQKYTNFEQGAIAAQTGLPTPNNSVSRTWVILVDEIYTLASPLGWETRLAYFSDEYGEKLIYVSNAARTGNYTYTADYIKTTYPTAKSIRMH